MVFILEIMWKMYLKTIFSNTLELFLIYIRYFYTDRKRVRIRILNFRKSAPFFWFTILRCKQQLHANYFSYIIKMVNAQTDRFMK